MYADWYWDKVGIYSELNHHIFLNYDTAPCPWVNAIFRTIPEK